MSDDLNPAQIETLKSRFREAGCTVKDLEHPSFEVVLDDFPVRIHVYANPYYLQLATNILAKPPKSTPISEVYKFVCAINSNANFARFTMLSPDKPDENSKAWPLLASVKLVTGVAGGDYTASAMNKLLLLFLQDIAELMASSEDFEIHPNMDEDKLRESEN